MKQKMLCNLPFCAFSNTSCEMNLLPFVFYPVGIVNTAGMSLQHHKGTGGPHDKSRG